MTRASFPRLTCHIVVYRLSTSCTVPFRLVRSRLTIRLVDNLCTRRTLLFIHIFITGTIPENVLTIVVRDIYILEITFVSVVVIVRYDRNQVIISVTFRDEPKIVLLLKRRPKSSTANKLLLKNLYFRKTIPVPVENVCCC